MQLNKQNRGKDGNMEENDSLLSLAVQVCVGVSALRVNLFFQTPLNYGHVTLLREGQEDCYYDC